jgi:hypothetical protein
VPADEFDPERILRVFADHGVDCLIVGGFGAQAHGAHRQTLDIDVIPRSTEANLERLAAALRDLGARLRVGGLTDDEARALPVTVDAATLRSFVSSTWMTDAGPVDVLGDLPVAGGRRAYDEMVERAVPRSVHGIVVHLASLEDIIASKEHADRDKDRHALPELRELLRLQRAGGAAPE